MNISPSRRLILFLSAVLTLSLALCGCSSDEPVGPTTLPTLTGSMFRSGLRFLPASWMRLLDWRHRQTHPRCRRTFERGSRSLRR